MAATDIRPRFFKVFISHFSSDTLMIPVSYYDQFPSLLPKTVTLQGSSGCCWDMEMKCKQDELYFGKGWAKFVKDNSLCDGDFLTFVYNGDRIFEVSIYGSDGCKETRSVIEVEDDKEDSICSLSSQNTYTSSESKMSETNSRTKNKGKKKEDSVNYKDESEEMDTNTDTCSDEDSDSDCIEAFGHLDFSENSDSNCSYYSPKKKVIKTKPKKKVIKTKPKKKVKAKIKNPEAYLDNPNNVYFETALKNRKSDLQVGKQVIKDYCLKFERHVNYIDKYGEVEAKTAKWRDQRVFIKKWTLICKRNKLKKEDRILCELLRKQDLVYAIKLHIVREKDL